MAAPVAARCAADLEAVAAVDIAELELGVISRPTAEDDIGCARLRRRNRRRPRR